MSDQPVQQTLLIVDDDPANVQALARQMHREYRVLVANSGTKALAIASGEVMPDLILLDVQMPDIDGFEVCRRLKDDPRTSSIPVIFVTARDSAGDEEAGFALGAVDYVSKPFHPGLVRARVRTHMRLKRKTDLLEQLAMLDGLTDIPNRRYFEDQLEREYRRAGRDRLALSLVMMDIDNFKGYNDNYGHGAGDQCLSSVARVLTGVAERPRDIVARYGGEEFVALLPSTDETGATEVAEQLRSAVEALQIPHDHSDAGSVVTLSLGVAAMNITDHPEQRETSGQLLKRADDALYRAKKSGKNTVCVADSVR